MDITGIILAGGKSTRMGEDKGLMTLFGKPMVEYVIDNISQICSDIIIVTENEDYKELGYDLVKDYYRNCGALGGIHAGLTASSTELNVVISCDVPYAKQGLIEYLLNQADDYSVTVPIHKGRIHPLIGIYSESCLPIIEEQIKTDDLKITNLFEYLDANVVDTDEFDDMNFKNLNSKSDFED